MTILYRYELKKLLCRPLGIILLSCTLALSVLAAVVNAQQALPVAAHWEGYQSGPSLPQASWDALSAQGDFLLNQRVTGQPLTQPEREALARYEGAAAARTPASAQPIQPAAEEKALLEETARLEKRPIKAGYTGSASWLFSALSLGFLIPALSMPFFLDGLFAEDARCGMDALQFSARFGRRRLLFCKLFAAVTVWLPVTVVCALLALLPPVLADPHTDWDASIQLLFPQAAYPLSLGQTAAILLSAGVLLSLSSALISLLLSNCCKAPLLGAFGGCVLVLFPLLRYLPALPEALSRALRWNLTSLLFGKDGNWDWLTIFDGVTLGGRFFSQMPLLLFLGGCLAVALLLGNICRFLTRQVRG